eukprot:297678_1
MTCLISCNLNRISAISLSIFCIIIPLLFPLCAVLSFEYIMFVFIRFFYSIPFGSPSHSSLIAMHNSHSFHNYQSLSNHLHGSASHSFLIAMHNSHSFHNYQ